jgi:hypothetical protein
MLWISAASLLLALGYASTDAFLYLIPAFLCFAIWIGMGLGRLMDAASQRLHWIGPLIGLGFLLAQSIQTGTYWHLVDASQDQRAEDFGSDVLRLAPADAIVFAEGDGAVFSLWYYQYAEKQRPDLTIVATDLLHFDWYQQILHTVYPDLNVPGPFPFVETIIVANPEHPVCSVQYIQIADIACVPVRDP